MRPLNILTWHTHGSYLYYMSQMPHRLYIVSKPGRPPGYGGKCGDRPWGDNVIDMPAHEIRNQQFDCIIFQDDHQYFHDQFEFMTPTQRRLPRIYIEHDTPREHPTDMPHPIDDPDVLLVHVTHFNALMWDNGHTPVKVIEHGVLVPDDVAYRGIHDRGIVVINNIAQRGRRLGGDVFAAVREQVPLALIGMGTEAMGGLGEISPAELPEFIADYRFFFNPIRYTSLGLAVIEAMMLGVPVIALATTEMATVIDNGRSGYIDTNIDKLIDHMHTLIKEPKLAQKLGQQGRKNALERFSIKRFVDDWNTALAEITGIGAVARRTNPRPKPSPHSSFNIG